MGSDLGSRVTTQEVAYYFRSSFVGTVLHCTARYPSPTYCSAFWLVLAMAARVSPRCRGRACRKGEAVFRSDNISTLSLLKEVITREATTRNVPLSINFGTCLYTYTHTNIHTAHSMHSHVFVSGERSLGPGAPVCVYVSGSHIGRWLLTWQH